MIQIAGRFRTSVGPQELRARHSQAEQLAAVNTLADVSVEEEGTIHARFTPCLPLGRVPLNTQITTTHTDDTSSLVTVHATRGSHSVDVTLAITLGRVDGGTEVSWTGELKLGGTAASVGQRVSADIAQRAINDVLTQLARP